MMSIASHLEGRVVRRGRSDGRYTLLDASCDPEEYRPIEPDRGISFDELAGLHRRFLEEHPEARAWGVKVRVEIDRDQVGKLLGVRMVRHRLRRVSDTPVLRCTIELNDRMVELQVRDDPIGREPVRIFLKLADSVAWLLRASYAL